MFPKRTGTFDSPAVGVGKRTVNRMPFTTATPPPVHFTFEELRELALTSDLARFALRQHIALAGIAAGGDRLKLQEIAKDAIRRPV